ncbi:DUF2919 family protein [Lacimicrobium alkaliphilum]|uniref:Membrane protein n=1 Tax=Lacimicrobium alkaliphilum TaxID=1526571 RepID=A0ABQ1R109_9ALTE|nr:DUF2919 family protein [Lacimicrobium alkaliphilum]GGD54357.1 membrane protein [Lacimicrobium alkaliphilum]
MNKPRAILPLKHYDEQGRIKPNSFMYLSLLFLIRVYLVSVASISYRQDTSLILSLFYPDKGYFYFSLSLGLPALLIMGMVFWRHKLFETHARVLFKPVRLVLLLSLSVDAGFHLLMAHQGHWAFSWVIAVTLLLDMLFALYWYRSRTLKLMLKDWQRQSQ